MTLLKDIIDKLPLGTPVEAEPLPEAQLTMMREFNAPKNVQTALKHSDATDAGSSEVTNKAKAGGEIGFSLMRNTINANGNVTGSDVANYIERAEELNDEVDTVPFGLETDDGQIVKVYVNAEQADKFEEAMKNMLGMEDDIEEAINRLTTEFDIVDVVWPRVEGEEGDEEADPDADLSIDDTSMLDPEDDEDFADDQYDVVAAVEPKKEKKDKEAELDDEIEAATKDDEDEDSEEEPEDSDEEDDEDSEEDEESDDEEDKPKKKKKRKKKAQPAEPVEDAVKESLNDKTAWARLNVWAEDQGEFGFSSMSEQEMKKVIDLQRADKLAKELHGEFGFATCTVKQMRDIINGNPDLVKEKQLTRLTQEEQQEKKMTIGSKFLSRVLNEDDLDEGKVTASKVKAAEARADRAELAVEREQGKSGYGRSNEKVRELRSKASKLRNDATVMAMELKKSLNEAESPEDRDGVRDGFNIPMDSQARALAAKLKLPMAKRLIAFMVMAGVPGRYLNTEGVEGTIAEATDMLRKKVAVRRAFLTMYDGLANAKGFTIPQEESVKEGIVTEAKLFIDDKEVKKGDPLKSTIKGGQPGMKFVAVKKNENGNWVVHAKISPAPRSGYSQMEISAKSVGGVIKESEDLAEAEGRQKRGSFIQKLFETVLVGLGLPESMITTTGPSAVGTGIYRTAELIEQDAGLERALRLLASRLGIKSTDAMKPTSEAQEIFAEAVDVGNDDFAQAVVTLVSALGIPDDVLERRRTQIVQALRAKKASLRNRSQVLTMMGRLQDIISKGTAPSKGQPEADTDTSMTPKPANESQNLSETFQIDHKWKQGDVSFAMDTDVRMKGGSLDFIEVYVYRIDDGKKNQIGHGYLMSADKFSEDNERAYIKKLNAELKKFRVPENMLDKTKIDSAVKKFIDGIKH